MIKMTEEPIEEYDHLLRFSFLFEGFDYDDCAQVEVTRA
jgi:hypothetical protein